MRILIINRFFWPDESSTAMLAADLAEDFAAAGHTVEVACARLLYDKPETHLVSREDWRGVRIHRLPSFRFGRSHIIGRFLDLISFHASLFLLAPLRFKPDVVVVMTDPAMVLLDAIWIARLRQAKIVHHVMDLYPDIATVLGALTPGSLSERLLQRLMSALLRRCNHIVVLGPAMLNRIAQKGVSADRLSIIPPWASTEGHIPIRDSNPFRIRLGLSPDDFLVMYSGNMGKAHPFAAVIHAMTCLKDHPRIHFAFVGGGTRAEEISAAVRRHALSRVHLLPYQPREKLSETLSAADLHLITQNPATSGMIVPSKLAGILSVGRPTISIGDLQSDVASVLTEFECGQAITPDDTDGLVHAIQNLARESNLRQEMGNNALKAYAHRFVRSKSTAEMLSLLGRLASES